jgi:hypothetical protein
MNIIIEQSNNTLEQIRNSDDYWKEILQDIKHYLIKKIATEYDRHNRHPHTDEMITHKEEKMSIWSEYQREQTEKKIENEKKMHLLKENNYNRLQERTNHIKPIVDMKSAYEQVQKNKTTINRDYARLTSSSLVV